MKNPFHMIIRFLLFPVAKILVPCKVMDKDKYSKDYDRGQLLIGNHLSWMDIPYQIFWLPGYMRFLSKKENGNNKIIQWFLNKVGVLLINRDKPELSSMRECIKTLKEGTALSVFPEGTRNRVNRELMEFHSGAAMFALKSGAKVIPVAVHHKAVKFKMNYIGVGDPVDLSDLYDKRMDENLLNEATARFKTALQQTLDRLDKWVEEKGWKTERKKIRARRRALKVQYKQAKKDAKAALKA